MEAGLAPISDAAPGFEFHCVSAVRRGAFLRTARNLHTRGRGSRLLEPVGTCHAAPTGSAVGAVFLFPVCVCSRIRENSGAKLLPARVLAKSATDCQFRTFAYGSGKISILLIRQTVWYSQSASRVGSGSL